MGPPFGPCYALAMIFDPAIRTILTPVPLLALCACSTLGLAPQAPPGPRPIADLDGDIAAVVLAVDLPPGVLPVPEQSRFTLDVNAGSAGARHASAALMLADGDSVDGELAPPAKGRSYYLLGLSDADRQSLRAILAWARAARSGGATPAFAVALQPAFCATGALDPARLTFSVRPVLPGAGAFAPLIADAPLSATLPAGAVALPACR